jgi:hypothetical protein
MFKIYLIGLIILISAILLNLIASKLQLIGGYDFINKLMLQGKDTFTILRVVDFIWLFFLYPFLLVATCKIAFRLL